MVRRSTRILLEIFLGCLAGTILLVVVTVWRLSQAPVHLYFLSPFLEQAFSDPESGVSAEIEDTVLVLGKGSRTLDLKALGIRLLNSDGFTIASLPEVSINLSLRALLQGVVAPTKIEIIGARVTLIRTRDGDFNFGQNAAEEQTTDPQSEALADLSVIVPELVEEMLSDPDPARPLSFLRTARIRAGSLTIYDRKLKTFWHAPEANMTLRRESEGLSGDMDLKLAAGQIEMNLALDLLYRERDAQTIVAANFVDLQLGVFAGLDERLAPMAGFEVPLRGAVSAVLEGDGFLRSIMFDLSGGAGVLSLPEYLPEALAVKQMNLTGSLDGAAEQLQLDQVSIAFAGKQGSGAKNGPVVSVNGQARVLEGDFQFDVEGKVSRVPADELGLYWPMGLGEGARDWVTTNIRRGIAEEASIKISLRVPSGDFETVEVESMTGGYRYRDLDLHFLRPMPPINGVSGASTFDLSRMTFDVAGGVLGDLTVGQSFVEIDFRDNPEQIFIDLPVSGPLRSSLELLNHERLNLVSGLGIEPADSTGVGQVRAQFGFPLINDLTFDSIEVGVAAELQEVGVKRVLFGRDATDGTLDLKLDNAGMTITGPVALDGLPADLKWRESFTDDDGPVSVFNVEAPRLDETDLANFGLDLRPYLKGPVAASAVYARQADRTADLDLVLDLDRADFAFPVIYWSKPPGTGGQMRLGVKLSEDKVEAIERIEVRAGTLTAIGRGMMDETGSQLVGLKIDELQFGQSRLSDVLVSLDDEMTAVDAGSGVLDAVPFMASQAGGQEEEEAGQDDQDAFTIRATRLDKVLFGPDRYLEKVTLELERRSEGWENIAITAEIPEALWSKFEEEEKPKDRHRNGPVSRSETGTGDEIEVQADKEPEPEVEPPPPEDRFFRLRYRPAAAGGYFLKAVSNDVGALLRAMDLRDTVRGGHLELVGQSDGPIPYHSLTAHLEVTDYALVGAPTLVKVLTAASMTGLSDTVSGKGIWFDRLSGDVILTDGVVETQLLHAFGSALGVTTKGEMDFDRAQLDLEGTVVPAYSINRVLGKIPGIGFLLTGGEHGGFLAFTYDVEGAFDDPDVEVDALSALAPGFLRGLFGGIDGDAPTVFPPGPDR